MTYEDAVSFVKRINWFYAKTYPTCPHEWTCVKRGGGKPQEFVDFAFLVEQEGTPEWFGKTKRKYLYIDGMKYWTMDYPLETTDLINRCYIDNGLNKRISDFVMSGDFVFKNGMSLVDVKQEMEKVI